MALVCPFQGLLINEPSNDLETDQLFVECPDGCPVLMAFPSKNEESLLIISGNY
jgi:hypothetical protein